MPKDDPAAWQMSVQQRLLEIHHDAYPILAENLKLLSNQAFTLRRHNGTDVPPEASSRRRRSRHQWHGRLPDRFWRKYIVACGRFIRSDRHRR